MRAEICIRLGSYAGPTLAPLCRSKAVTMLHISRPHFIIDDHNERGMLADQDIGVPITTTTDATNDRR